jgi:hypothetical protein
MRTLNPAFAGASPERNSLSRRQDDVDMDLVRVATDTEELLVNIRADDSMAALADEGEIKRDEERRAHARIGLCVVVYSLQLEEDSGSPFLSFTIQLTFVNKRW